MSSPDERSGETTLSDKNTSKSIHDFGDPTPLLVFNEGCNEITIKIDNTPEDALAKDECRVIADGRCIFVEQRGKGTTATVRWASFGTEKFKLGVTPRRIKMGNSTATFTVKNNGPSAILITAGNGTPGRKIEKGNAFPFEQLQPDDVTISLVRSPGDEDHADVELSR